MKIPLKLRLRVAMKGLFVVLKQPVYLIIAAAITSFTLGIVLWSLNLDLLRYILFEAPLGLFDKFDFVIEIYGGILTNYGSFQAMIMVLFSVLFGINAAMLLFVVKSGHRDAVRSKSSVGGLFAAIIGGGCIACGTSIITPIVASFGATATVGLNNAIGTVVNLIGILLICYSLVGLGQRAATLKSS